MTRNKLYDVYTNGVWQNPYEDKSTFIIAPSINKYKGLDLKVKLPQDIFLSNYPAEIQSVAVNFGDGLGYRAINYNQSLNVNYTQANTYIWQYKLTLINGQILYSHSKVEIEEGLNTKSIATLKTPHSKNTPSTNNSQNSPLDAYFKTMVTATVPFYGQYGRATLFIRDVNNDGIINPLIVAEGFDEGVITNPEQEAGNNNILNFINSVNQDGGFQLQNEINTYDIIYVDWDNGVDFLQRNAFALEEAIRWVNDNKMINATPNTIIGQSMGGLIARYALADIEQNQNFNHDTTLYISHDAPHLGANTPIGMQHMYRHVNNMYHSAPLPLLFGEVLIPLAYDASGIYEDIVNDFFLGNVSTDLGTFVTPSQYLSIADLPASRQMLYNWVNTDYDIFNTIHDAWQQDLSNIGYPQGDAGQPIRNIAIANGSECGTDYDVDTLISYNKTAADKTILNSIIGLTDIGVGLVLTGTWQGAVLIALGVLPGSSKYDIAFNASAMRVLNANKQIYSGNITYKKKILWFIPVSVNLVNETQPQPFGVLPYDVYGGGAYTIENYLGDLFDQLPTIENNGTFGRYDFIPTASSLDIGSGAVTINDQDYRMEYIGANPPPTPKNSPFDNFVSHFDQNNPQNNNSEHISFNRRNGDWLATELAGNDALSDDCTFRCDDGEIISGPSLICSTGSYSLSIDVTSVTWDLIPASAGTITPNPSDNTQITIDKSLGYNGSVTLIANIVTNGCGSPSVVKTIHFGVPTGTASISGDADLYPGPTDSAYFLVNLSNVNASETVTWSVYSGSFQNANLYFTKQTYNNPNSVVIMANQNTPEGTYYVRAEISNACGSMSASRSFYLNEGGDPQFYPRIANNYNVYPNPSKDIVNIALISNKNEQTKNDIKVSGELFDVLGKSKLKVNIQHNGAQFNVAGLNPGVYVLKIYLGETIETHQILVK